MVLIDCPTCKRRMDVVRKECPGCGKALEKRKSGWTQRPIIIDVVLFLGGTAATLWFLWWLITGPSF